MGPHRARRLRSQRKRFEAAAYSVTQTPLTEIYPLVARLAAATVNKYQPGTADEDLMREGFRQQAAMAQDLAQVVVASSEGRQVGCCLFYRHGDTVYLRAVGFDYPRLKNAAEYSTLAYYLPAGWEGVRRIHAGIGSPHAKALHGAVLQPLWLLDLSDSAPRTMKSRVVRHNENAYRDLRADPVLSKAVDHDQFDLIL